MNNNMSRDKKMKTRATMAPHCTPLDLQKSLQHQTLVSMQCGRNYFTAGGLPFGNFLDKAHEHNLQPM